MSEAFQEAAKKAKSLTERPSNDTLLQLYALYKQATEGDVTGERPGMFDFKERAKYDAWADIEGKSKEEAEKAYIQLVESLA
ncbi:MAG: acyl-CoA-binding protein [Bernardetiaceae bacterium]|nr:acyl-CoA-binding protein [Bernardetiaceae bacterium]